MQCGLLLAKHATAFKVIGADGKHEKKVHAADPKLQG
jgi:hypothetical protein